MKRVPMCGKVFGRHRCTVVRPRRRLVKGDVFFNHHGAQRHRRQGCVDAFAVVGVADRQRQRVGQGPDGAQVQRFRFGGVVGRAMQHTQRHAG